MFNMQLGIQEEGILKLDFISNYNLKNIFSKLNNSILIVWKLCQITNKKKNLFNQVHI